MKLTKKDICKFLVAYHHLTPENKLKKEEIMNFVKKVGCIQYDPLDVVGKNPDLVLQSRCEDYKKQDIYHYLYEDRKLFDVWDKSMSICSIEDWPYFSRFRKSELNSYEIFKEKILQITEELNEKEFACSSDFKIEGRIDSSWGSKRLSREVLEYMCYAGLAVVHHKKGTRRYYSLSEKLIPKELLEGEDPNKLDSSYNAWRVLRRINSIGVLWNRASDAWIGLRNFKSKDRIEGFNELLREDKIIPLEVEGIKSPLYIDKSNLDLLKQSINSINNKKEAYIIAPLDNLIWDRKLINELFNFDYKWEVYVPAEKRKYGYYVLPILYGIEFIGRIEFKLDKVTNRINIKNLWWEDNILNKDLYTIAINEALKKLGSYMSCNEIETI